MSDEAARFLESHPDTRGVQLLLTDPSGVSRGKLIDRAELDALYRHGRNVAGSILGLDITGEDVEATGLVWSSGDADFLCRPVAGSLRPAPWLDRTGQVMMSMYELDGRPAAADPRHTLARVIARLGAANFTAVVACELEFYLLRQVEGQWVPAAASGRPRALMNVTASTPTVSRAWMTWHRCSPKCSTLPGRSSCRLAP